MDELAKRILHRRQLEEQEDKPVVPYNPCVGMSPEEMSRYIQFLFEQLQQKDAQHKELLEQLAGIKEDLKAATSEQKRLNALVLSLTNQLHDAQQTITNLTRKNEDLLSSARVYKKQRFGSSSQKGCKALDDVSGRDDNKDDFDGTVVDSLNYSCHL